MEEWLNQLNKLHPVSPELQNFLSEKMQVTFLKKNQHLVCEGDFNDRLYFVTKGVLRSYTLEETDEITTSIVAENKIFIAYTCFYHRQPAKYFVQATEKTVLLSISNSEVDFCYKHFRESVVISSLIMTWFAAETYERLAILKIRNATDRYKKLLRYYPEMVSRVPVRHLASYLGISFETLSRIRKQIAK